MTRVRGNKKFVFVRIFVKRQEVFRGKFILVSLIMKMTIEYMNFSLKGGSGIRANNTRIN